MPELINTATRRKLRPLQLDNFIRAFSVAGEKQEKAVDKKTVTLLERLSGNADVEKARAEFERAQKVEETFHKDFDGIDFTIYFSGIKVRFCERRCWPSFSYPASKISPTFLGLHSWQGCDATVRSSAFLPQHFQADGPTYDFDTKLSV